MRKTAVVLCVIATMIAVPCAAQINFDTIQVRAVPVAANIHMLQGAGGNIGLAVGDDAVFVVDDQYAPLTRKVLAAIATITPKPVRFVVNTHWHMDHVGGNETLGDRLRDERLGIGKRLEKFGVDKNETDPTAQYKAALETSEKLLMELNKTAKEL